MIPLLGLLPWLALLAFVFLAVRPPRDLPRAGDDEGGGLPSVSVVVPARNEAGKIEDCLRSLAVQDHPDFEIVVVDDRSEDGTGERARSVGAGNASSLRVLDGAEVPEGWMGKQWACWQGQAGARGELLLFIDADTHHEPDLLRRAAAELRREEADLLSVAGRQLYGSFWERLIQPQVLFAMILRWWNLERWIEEGRWRHAIASGAYLLFTREAYDALGGHEVVKGAVAEDLALAQRTVRTGRRLVVRLGEDALSIRMYTSLSEIVGGWGKNMHVGGLETVAPWLRPLIPPASLASGFGLWLLPPAVLGAAGLGWLGGGWAVWAAGAVLLSLLLWVPVYRRAGAPGAYGFLYPLGAALGAWIYLRSWMGGRNVEWKGRRYEVEAS